MVMRAPGDLHRAAIIPEEGDMGFFSSLWPFQILRQLRQAREASTFERLGESRHVADLRLIFSVTVALVVVASVVALAFCFQHEVMFHWSDIRKPHSGWLWARLAFTAVADSGVFIGSIGAVGCGILAWTYQTGSARLGVVDLFACEIATLCRVVAVCDMVPHHIRLFCTGAAVAVPRKSDRDSPAGARFTSEEHYFPVFDAAVRDLQQLEADVVTNVTAFYTYMKVMRDGLRKFTEMPRPSTGADVDDDWHRALYNVIYMQFLALESARKAIRDLVEFEPTQAEDICTILLSELVAYRFLRNQFSGDLRQRRLASREPQYREEIPGLYSTVHAGAGPHWEKARDLAEVVMKLYVEIFLGDTGSAGAPEAAAEATLSMSELVR
jgi:hypothetical protein